MKFIWAIEIISTLLLLVTKCVSHLVRGESEERHQKEISLIDLDDTLVPKEMDEDYSNRQMYRHQHSHRSIPAKSSQRILDTERIGDPYFLRLQTIETKIEDTDSHFFGKSISISYDGSTLAVAGSLVHDEIAGEHKGYVDIYKVPSFEKISPRIYTDVDISAPCLNVHLNDNGSRLAISVVYQRSFSEEDIDSGVEVWHLVDDEYIPLGRPIEASGEFGDFPGLRISLSGDGEVIVIGGQYFDADDKGQTTVFKLDEYNIWQEIGYLEGDSAGDHEGSSVSMTRNGAYFASGATGFDAIGGDDSGAVRIYDVAATTQIGNTITGEGDGDACGFSVGLVMPTESMLRVAVGSIYNNPSDDKSDAGHVRVYDYNIAAGIDSTWSIVGREMNGENGLSLDFVDGMYHVGQAFGFSLALSSKGDRVVIGSPYYSHRRESEYYYGHVKLYEYNEGVSDWIQIGMAVVGERGRQASGYSVDLTGDGKILAIGGQATEGEPGQVTIENQSEISNYPSLSPSLDSSGNPSSHPTVSQRPSTSPSSFSDRTFMIMSTLDSFGSFEEASRSWCLETSSRTGGSALKIRPCDASSRKQFWHYDEKKIILAGTSVPKNFCIKDEAYTLFLQSCDQVVNSFYLGEGITDGKEGSIYVRRGNRKKKYFGIDAFKIFSRVRLFREGLENSSTLKWKISFDQHVSKTLSEAPSISTSAKPSTIERKYPTSVEVPTIEPTINPDKTERPSATLSVEPSTFRSNYPTNKKDSSSKPTITLPRDKAPSVTPSMKPSKFQSNSPTNGEALTSKPTTTPSQVEAPSVTPSMKPSKFQSNSPSTAEVPNPSLSPSLDSSGNPSSHPTVSQRPSTSPSSFSDRTFMIMSTLDSFGSFEEASRSWCLETSSRTGGSALKIRPCDASSRKQFWHYDEKKIILAGTSVPKNFCIKDEAYTLFLQSCDQVVNFFHLNKRIKNGKEGSIYVKRRGKRNVKFYFGIDAFKIFSRVRLFREGLENSSTLKWKISFDGAKD